MYRLHEKIRILSSPAHGKSIYTTTKVVTDLHDTEFDERQQKQFNVLTTFMNILQKIVPGKFKRNLLLKLHSSCAKFLKFWNRQAKFYLA